jgi:hypothetical protein
LTAGRRYLLFLAVLAGATVALLAAGYLPTRSLAGEAALPAMLLACAISFVGSAVGGLPLARVGVMGTGGDAGAGKGDGGVEGLKRVITAMALRLAVVVVLAGAVILLVGPERKPFLLWLALSYLVLLVADTGYAQTVLRRL